MAKRKAGITAMETMTAAFLAGRQDLRVEQRPIPEIGAGDALLKVKACAVCGTDIRIYNYGHFKIPEGTNRILGHEVAGEIVAVGNNVRSLRQGMRVVTAPNIGCGICPQCIDGYNQMCPDYDAFGISLDGGFAQYMKIPEHAIAVGNVVEIPSGLSFEQATLIEPFSCCYNSYRRLRTQPGETLVVIGAGPIGALHVMMHKLAGATNIIVADISDARLEEVRGFGADYTVNSGKEELVQAVKTYTNGRGADVVITACSIPQLQQTALEIAAVHGRINFFGGLPKEKELVTLNTNLIHYKELTALGSTGSTISDFVHAKNIIASGKIPCAGLVSKTFPIAQAQEALQFAMSGEGMKTVLVG